MTLPIPSFALDYEITPAPLGRAKWEVFDARDGETLRSGEALCHAHAEAAALQEIQHLRATRGTATVELIPGEGWQLVYADISAPLPFTRTALPTDVLRHVQDRFPGVTVRLGISAQRHAEYLEQLATSPSPLARYWAGSASASVARDNQAGRTRTIRR